MIFVDDNRNILLHLRDDKPDIPEPNKWDLTGGLIEEGETPEQAIVREVREELEIELRDIELFKRTEFEDRIEWTFTTKLNRPASDIPLHEGQALRWFSPHELTGVTLAFGFSPILAEFLAKTQNSQANNET